MKQFKSTLPPLLPTPSAIDTSVPCQICNRYGHTARVCYDRGNFAYAASSQDLNHLECGSWYVDSGATQHMTPHVQNIHTPSSYTGTEAVVVGNGCSLPIKNIGTSTFSNSLQLRHVLHVPLLTKNLLSVQRFSSDNNYYFLLDDLGFSVKDKTIGRTLLSGPSSFGSYRASLPPPSLPACLSAQVSSSLWHHRLGNPSSVALGQTLRCADNQRSPSKYVYSTYPLGKSTSKPFGLCQHTVSSPLQLLHLDLWGPAPTVSVDTPF